MPNSDHQSSYTGAQMDAAIAAYVNRSAGSIALTPDSMSGSVGAGYYSGVSASFDPTGLTATGAGDVRDGLWAVTSGGKVQGTLKPDFIDFNKFYYDRETITFNASKNNINEVMSYAATLYQNSHSGTAARCVGIQIIDKTSWSNKQLLAWTSGWTPSDGWYGRLWRWNSSTSAFEMLSTNSGSYYDAYVASGTKAEAVFSVLK